MQYQVAALSSATFSSYQVGFRSYNSFCLKSLFHLLPLDEEVLQRYVVSLARRLSYGTIKVYLCGVQYFSRMFGLPQSITSMVRLYYLLRGFRRTQGPQYTRALRNPITTNHLRLIYHRIQFLDYSNFQRVALRAASSLAFFGFLRCSECTCRAQAHFDPSQELMVYNVTIAANHSLMTIFIRASKTDPFKAGCHIRIGATGKSTCPINCMVHYLNIHPRPRGPLFKMTDSQFLTRQDIVTMLSRCLPEVLGINTHSFHIGGASAAASAGISDSTIQLLGRWSSDAYRRYLCLSNDTIIGLSQSISWVHDFTRFWSQQSLRSTSGDE